METSILKSLRAGRREQAIEDMLYAYPGLIEPGLWQPRRQVALAPDSRSDLLFEVGNRVVIVEIKRDAITLAAVRQIERYAALVTKKTARITGYLIAPELDPRAEKAMEKSRHRLSFRALGVDIPTRIKVCRDCRRPYDERADRCPVDGSRVVI